MQHSLYDSIGRYISVIYRNGNAILTKKFSTLGIGSGQYMFLFHLYRCDGINQEYLAEKLCIDKGTAARAIKKLEDTGFVYRVRDEADQRAYKIYITEKAKEIEQDFHAILHEWENTLSSSLTEAEYATLLNHIKLIATSVTKRS